MPAQARSCVFVFQQVPVSSWITRISEHSRSVCFICYLEPGSGKAWHVKFSSHSTLLFVRHSFCTSSFIASLKITRCFKSNDNVVCNFVYGLTGLHLLTVANEMIPSDWSFQIQQIGFPKDKLCPVIWKVRSSISRWYITWNEVSSKALHPNKFVPTS